MAVPRLVELFDYIIIVFSKHFQISELFLMFIYPCIRALSLVAVDCTILLPIFVFIGATTEMFM